MTVPAPGFAEVLPPADGLRLAFASARRRRRRKAAIGMGLGAVVLTTALALHPPAGRSVLQQPVQPAGRTGAPALPGIDVPAPQSGSNAAPRRATAPSTQARSKAVAGPADPAPELGRSTLSCSTQAGHGHLLCAGLRTGAAGRTTLDVQACAAGAAAVAVSSAGRQLEASTGSCDAGSGERYG